MTADLLDYVTKLREQMERIPDRTIRRETTTTRATAADDAEATAAALRRRRIVRER